MLKDSEIKSKVANLDKIIQEKYSEEYNFLINWKGFTGSVAELIILTEDVLYDKLYKSKILDLMGMVDQSDLKIGPCNLNLLRNYRM